MLNIFLLKFSSFSNLINFSFYRGNFGGKFYRTKRVGGNLGGNFIEQKEFEEILEENFIEQKDFLNNILCTKDFFKRGFIEGEIREEKVEEI